MKLFVQLVAFAVTLNTAGATLRPEGYTPEIDRILRAMLESYSEAASYQDNGQLTILQQTGRVRQITKMPSSVTLDRRNEAKLQVLGGMQSISCDGKHLQIVLDSLKQFQSREAPSKLTMDDVRIGAPGAGLDQGYPEILEFLLGDDVLNRWISQIRSISLVQAIEIASHQCKAISYETIHGAKINLFVDSERNLLLRCDIDNTAAQQSPNAPQSNAPTPTLKVVLQLAPVELNTALNDNVFATTRPNNMREVEVFQAQQPTTKVRQEPNRTNLIGKVAPPIPDQNFTDKPALLFFWSPDAGPGNLAAIQMVERLRVGAEGSGVAFLSLAAAGADPGVVGDLLTAKKAGYATATDATGEIARLFQIEALPAFVIIGADGKIQHKSSGDPHAAEAELTRQLRSL